MHPQLHHLKVVQVRLLVRIFHLDGHSVDAVAMVVEHVPLQLLALVVAVDVYQSPLILQFLLL